MSDDIEKESVKITDTKNSDNHTVFVGPKPFNRI